MSNNLENIYYQLPYYIQNIFVSIKGLELQRTRKSGLYTKYRAVLDERNNWTMDDYLNYQNTQFVNTFKHAINNIPFYKNFYQSHGITEKSIQSIDDITLLPVVTKQIIKNNNILFIDPKYDTSRLHTIKTTGTTGTPLKVYCDNSVRQLNYAFFDNFLDSVNINPFSKRIVLGGRVIMSGSHSKPPFWRYSFFQKSLLMSSYHLNHKNISFYVDKIITYRPEYIDSYPSSIFQIAKYILDNNIVVNGLKGIVTSSETLYDEQRKVIQEAFSTKIYDQYGAAEMCVFVAQCSCGSYHYRPDYGVLEIVTNNFHNAYDTLGNIICTSFINPIMPLIRYDIGDIASFAQTTCQCGLDTPILTNIQGRKDDYIITPDGRKIGRLSPVLKDMPVESAQYIQTQIDSITVKVVPTNDFDRDTYNQVIKKIQARIGLDTKISIELVSEIPRGPGGKLQNVISMLNKK